ncbi:hypothetical protein L965_601 [Leuconostoc pseudomesenteroides PS12]|nr:hypothetical protein L964_1814 [Leuconostoc pseudomesenteroides 1159]KDA49992.1 hypothetical protein L965_601 [Leuconostoc pseudomesenteroides PS12]CCJ67037.1 hypothetical protein Q5C_10110 [Leuconostoc pseudomesenteroides 4882]
MIAKTAIVIAHRLSTVHKADQIIVMNDGRVAEAGTLVHMTLSCSRKVYINDYTMPNLNNFMTKKTLYDLMVDHQDKIAKLQFYDMADQYFLTIGDWSMSLSESNATELFSIFKDDEQATFSTFNQRTSLIVTQKKNPK